MLSPHTLLRFSRNKQTLALCLGEFGFNISATTYRQHVSRDIATVRDENPCHHIPKGRFSVSTFAVGNYKCLDINLTNSGKTDYLLDIVNKVIISAEKQFKSSLPYIIANIIRVNGGLLCDIVFSSVWPAFLIDVF